MDANTLEGIMDKKWWQSKTIWTGAAGLLTTVGAFAVGEMGSADALQTGLISLIGIFTRMGMLK
jgi:Flp pilus assembly protein protease CpaA